MGATGEPKEDGESGKGSTCKLAFASRERRGRTMLVLDVKDALSFRCSEVIRVDVGEGRA